MAVQKHDKPDENEIYTVARKRGKSTGIYADPFKDHMKHMENKLKYGEGGSPPTKTYGGFADNSISGTRSQAGFQSVQRQRELANIPAASNNDTLSLP